MDSWHADGLIIDRRQRVLFCQDEPHSALFFVGSRRSNPASSGGSLLLARPAAMGCPPRQVAGAELALGVLPFRHGHRQLGTGFDAHGSAGMGGPSLVVTQRPDAEPCRGCSSSLSDLTMSTS